MSVNPSLSESSEPSRWRVEAGVGGLRLVPVVRRSLGSEQLTWADLLGGQLGDVRVFTLLFPSRFDTPADAVAVDALRTFAAHTGSTTSVCFWDPKDPEFSRALSLFQIKAPPALVFASGLQLKGALTSSGQQHVYALAITDPAVLADRDQLAKAANTLHEVVSRSNPTEMTGFVRDQKVAAVVQALARLSTGLRDEVLRLKPKLSLPGGMGVQLG